MTDPEIIKGLIERNNKVMEEFFFDKCRPFLILNYEVDYDEFVNELYIYLMENDAQKLRKFKHHSSVYFLITRPYRNMLTSMVMGTAPIP